MPAPKADTICALATAVGFGAIAVVRVSGPKTFRILDRLARNSTASCQPSHTVRLVWLVDRKGRPVDQVLRTVFRSPRSYTGEDMAELSCHGGVVTADRILKLLVAAGCRLAEPGEFTRRAVLNGKLTLSQAEAVLDLVTAGTPAGQAAALARYRGELSRFVGQLGQRLRDLYAETEFELGFEPDEERPADRRTAQIRGLVSELGRVIDQGTRSRFLTDGAQVAIVGRPNVGKSSLFNRLLEQNRALVSPIPGTTRDRVEAQLVINNIPVRLSDTGGVPTRTRHPLTRLAVAQTKAALENADLVLAVFDGSEPAQAADNALLEKLAGRDTIYVVNKNDRPHRLAMSVLGTAAVSISCRTGNGLSRLRQRIARRLRPGTGSPALTTNLRHLQVLRQTKTALERSLTAPDLETSAIEIRTALDTLAQIDAPVTNTELLDRVFARFCVGK